MKIVKGSPRRGLLRRRQHDFRLVADNGNVFATSESYNNVEDRDAAIDTIQREAAGARVIEELP